MEFFLEAILCLVYIIGGDGYSLDGTRVFCTVRRFKSTMRFPHHSHYTLILVSASGIFLGTVLCLQSKNQRLGSPLSQHEHRLCIWDDSVRRELLCVGHMLGVAL